VPARLARLLAIALLASGCGGEEKREARPRVDPAIAADELAVRCGLARPVPGEVPAIVPEGLLPPGSYIARARRTESSARATILLPIGFAAAHATLSANAKRAGYSVIFSEQELLEAEVYMSSPGGLVKFRIYGSRLCPDSASQVLFERSYTEG
jgi:hypothetical protein